MKTKKHKQRTKHHRELMALLQSLVNFRIMTADHFVIQLNKYWRDL